MTHDDDAILNDVHAEPPIDTRYIAGLWHPARLELEGIWIEAKVLAKALVTPANTGIRKFLVIGRARSGTTLLTDMLNSHPDVRCDREVLVKRVLAPERYLRNLAAKNRNAAYGAKILSYQMIQVQRFRDPVGFLANLEHQGFQLIHLERQTFTQTLSLHQAQKSGRFLSQKGGMRGSLIELDIDGFLERLRWSDMLLRYERRCLRDLPHLHLGYERDLSTEASQAATAQRLFEWIGVPPAPATSSLRKILPSDPRTFISNYDALREAIDRRGLNHVFDTVQPTTAPS